MRFPKLPWVSRARFDEALRALATEQKRAVDLEIERSELNEFWDKRCAEADKRASEAFATSLKAIVEARSALGEATALSKLAGAALFGMPTAGEIENPPSVGSADRAVAQRMRQQEDEQRLGRK